MHPVFDVKQYQGDVTHTDQPGAPPLIVQFALLGQIVPAVHAPAAGVAQNTPTNCAETSLHPSRNVAVARAVRSAFIFRVIRITLLSLFEFERPVRVLDADVEIQSGDRRLTKPHDRRDSGARQRRTFPALAPVFRSDAPFFRSVLRRTGLVGLGICLEYLQLHAGTSGCPSLRALGLASRLTRVRKTTRPVASYASTLMANLPWNSGSSDRSKSKVRATVSPAPIFNAATRGRRQGQLVSMRSTATGDAPGLRNLTVNRADRPALISPSETGSGLISIGEDEPAKFIGFVGGGDMVGLGHIQDREPSGEDAQGDQQSGAQDHSTTWGPNRCNHCENSRASRPGTFALPRSR